METINNDLKLFFPLHLDSGNRGCEAIARGIIEIFELKRNNYYGISRIRSNDDITKLSSEVSYIPETHSLIEKILHRIKTIICRTDLQQKDINYQYKFQKILDTLNNDTITLITGGDMMCYGDNEVNYIADYLSKNKKKVVLWGCSIGKENITQRKIKALESFDLITARESLTYEYLTKELGLTNVRLYPDPAFVLKPEIIMLPDYFSNKCIGVNLSNFVTATVDSESMIGKNIIRFMQHIMNNTNYHIVLIPHVFWPEQDDREVCIYYRKLFPDENRIHILSTEKMNYNQIRFAISKCCFFIGARTHSVISAYAMCIPTIALGYSIKSHGIAKDLNMPDYSVLDYRQLTDEHELIERFNLLKSDSDKIRQLLIYEIPKYIKKTYDSKTCVEEFVKEI